MNAAIHTSSDADVIHMRAPMAANSYFKLAIYRACDADIGKYHNAASSIKVESLVFPFNTESSISRVKAIKALHAAMKPEEGSVLRISVWRHQEGYEFPTIGRFQEAQV